jgi:glycine betaine/proline transport system ATP-binding protein
MLDRSSSVREAGCRFRRACRSARPVGGVSRAPRRRESFQVIRVEGVTKIFGDNPRSALPLLEQGRSKSEIQAETGNVVGVNNASFEIGQGEVFAIMGLSGSGKSTLIRCMNRLVEPTSGRILLMDGERGEKDITAMDRDALRMMRRHDMSMVFQHFALFPHRSVLSNTVYGLEIQGQPKSEREEAGRRILEMVGLKDWANSYPSELSGGMQQRVGLARALATDAKVLLMDEPFSALDPLIRVNMQQELKTIQSELGRTILFITHDLDEAMSIGDRIAIMEDGRMIQIGTPEEILVNPRTEYVARFVEHADPTGVITAGTIALPLNGEAFETLRKEKGERVVVRRGQPEIEYTLDGQGRLSGASSSGQPVEVKPLEELAGNGAAGTGEARRSDLLLTCSGDTVLRRLLVGRTRSVLPVLVTDADGRVTGVIDEMDLINGILEKRGRRDVRDESSQARLQSAGAK